MTDLIINNLVQDVRFLRDCTVQLFVRTKDTEPGEESEQQPLSTGFAGKTRTFAEVLLDLLRSNKVASRYEVDQIWVFNCAIDHEDCDNPLKPSGTLAKIYVTTEEPTSWQRSISSDPKHKKAALAEGYAHLVEVQLDLLKMEAYFSDEEIEKAKMQAEDILECRRF